ncbi:hypothetical protein ATB95_02770 [Elizabethkingia miricola]|uniref:Uncharacterized protein n=1 Tax=Elizabethkingia miricola TaxID=172045 RepID=A0ABD4DM96_ELIMR|nr:hypothetical protein ATB95_02770 [Elizabethkingia miricola]
MYETLYSFMSLNAMSVKVLTENMHNGKVNNDALNLYLRIKFQSWEQVRVEFVPLSFRWLK